MFPCEIDVWPDASKYPPGAIITSERVKHSGMSLRDFFAAQAVVAFMSSPQWVRSFDEAVRDEKANFKHSLAANAYEMADAMLKARDSHA